MSVPSKNHLLEEEVFTAEHFLSAAECSGLIELAERTGFEPATVNTAEGHQMLPDWRNNTRVILDDAERAEALWQQASQFVPATIEGWKAIGVNERLRFYRYDPGQQFDWHTDGFFCRDNGDRSHITFMIYLNGGFSGGETSFTDDAVSPRFPDFDVTPAAGRALFFRHILMHKGQTVTEGRKYVLRTDVMFTEDGGTNGRG